MTHLVLFVILVALLFDFLNGFHDAANSIATVVTPEGKNSFQILINDLPKPTDEIEDNDVLVVVGSDENIERLARGEA